MVASLTKQLQEEKMARKKLESELSQLQAVSTEIQKKLSQKADRIWNFKEAVSFELDGRRNLTI